MTIADETIAEDHALQDDIAARRAHGQTWPQIVAAHPGISTAAAKHLAAAADKRAAQAAAADQLDLFAG